MKLIISLLFILSSCATVVKQPITVTHELKQPVNYEGIIAVLDFNNNSPNKNWNYMEKAIAEIFSAKLSNYPNFKVVERERIDRILKEITLSQSGLVDVHTAVKVGKILGATAMVMGSVTQLGETIVVSARLVDVETGQIFLGQMSSCENEKELSAIVMTLVEKIVTSLK